VLGRMQVRYSNRRRDNLDLICSGLGDSDGWKTSHA
jgi:hypothetical protein